jgi:hypothetical protein
MDKSNFKSDLGIALILGSIWGFAEAALGFGLHRCAAMVSGSLMTGVALFFIAAGWAATRHYYVPILIVVVACLFKLFDASLLNLPVIHGAVANPIFAFLTEGLAIMVLIAIFTDQRLTKKYSRVLLGAGSALVAVCLFPLVKYATGIPACVFTGTTIPLSIYFAPVAIVFSAITVPLAFPAGEKIKLAAASFEMAARQKILMYLITPATVVLCLVLIVVFRLIFPESLS